MMTGFVQNILLNTNCVASNIGIIMEMKRVHNESNHISDIYVFNYMYPFRGIRNSKRKFNSTVFDSSIESHVTYNNTYVDGP